MKLHPLNINFLTRSCFKLNITLCLCNSTKNFLWYHYKMIDNEKLWITRIIWILAPPKFKQNWRKLKCFFAHWMHVLLVPSYKYLLPCRLQINILVCKTETITIGKIVVALLKCVRRFSCYSGCCIDWIIKQFAK